MSDYSNELRNIAGSLARITYVLEQMNKREAERDAAAKLNPLGRGVR